MHRTIAILALGLLANGLLVVPSYAGETLREEIDALKRRAEDLESQRQVLFRQDVEGYLAKTVSSSAQGANPLQGITIDARLTAVFLATLNADPSNTHSGHGDADLDFNFEVTDNLDLFIHLTANTEGAFPSEFGQIAEPSLPPISGGGLPSGGPFGGATLSGLFDGIGVDGTVSTSPGSVRVREAGIEWRFAAGDRTIHVLMGKLDPRDRFAQNEFAGDENTQFLNNLFDDPPAISWRTNASGVTIFGLHGWTLFGERDQYRFDIGWYNQPGQWFNDGILHFQGSWTGELQGRTINVRIYGQVDSVPRDVSAAVGVSADWWATDTIGVFARITVHDNQSANNREPNQVESDWQLGAIFVGLIPQRPDDTLGVAWGLIKGPIRGTIPGAENDEMIIEIYYRYMHEEGKLQISPMVQFIIDPGASTFAEPDSLVLLGVRFYVPF